jgi:hypothetical protein
MATKNEKSGYAMYEKTENVLMKKKELKKPEGKKEKARETKVGMKMMKKAAPMKKMGKKK